MCQPDFPQSDAYDHNPQVAAHFTKTPELTRLTSEHYFYRVDQAIRPKLDRLYQKHNIRRSSYMGLYYSGTEEWLAYLDRDRTLVLVLEMTKGEIQAGRWRLMDQEVRELMRRYGLSGHHGVCIRYHSAYMPTSPRIPSRVTPGGVQPVHDADFEEPWARLRQNMLDAMAYSSGEAATARAVGAGEQTHEDDEGLGSWSTTSLRTSSREAWAAENLSRYARGEMRPLRPERTNRAVGILQTALDGQQIRARSTTQEASPSAARTRTVNDRDTGFETGLRRLRRRLEQA